MENWIYTKNHIENLELNSSRFKNLIAKINSKFDMIEERISKLGETVVGNIQM